jgi:hypothetical protein
MGGSCEQREVSRAGGVHAVRIHFTLFARPLCTGALLNRTPVYRFPCTRWTTLIRAYTIMSNRYPVEATEGWQPACWPAQ